MLLLGGRYGSIEPKSGLSYIELEYRYATEVGKPFFALVMEDSMLDEKNRSEGRSVSELESPQKYKDFRQLVLSSMSKFFSNVDKLQLAIMQSLIDAQNRHSLTGWVRANEGVGAAKVLNEISELSERNRHPEEEIANLYKQIRIKSEINITE
jgi:hypothetical protein